ncbi:MAG: phosphopentomutase [Clostridiales bacterium]|jgi:phosphopentomutase|nr:phosphopentomutase [Clostridiales bacterium]
MLNRIHVIVLDSAGIGAAPDAADFNDLGCDTFGHISDFGVTLPNMEKLGLGMIKSMKGIKAIPDHKGYAGKLEEKSVGKDTLTGHWELMGVISQTPFPVYEKGFDKELLGKLEAFSGRKIICNLPYSGTDVLRDYGEEHLKTGALIVYTSADSVLQVAAHEEVVPLEELYKFCAYAREITMAPPWLLGRIIARPFLGAPGNFSRTTGRHDYALSPPRETALDYLKNAGLDVIAIGKINDIFNKQGITKAYSTKGNMDGVDKAASVMKEDFTGLSFTNLVDFDMLYGHRRDLSGYAKALEAFDARLPELMGLMREDDLLVLTADHGNDPTFTGTDHTREYVPIIAYSPSMASHGELPIGNFADLAATICDNFGVQSPGGNSFLGHLS